MQSLVNKVHAILDRDDPDIAKTFLKNYQGGDTLVDLNNYFRKQLTRCPIPTLEERSCLLDDLSAEYWIEYFKDQVAPTIIRFNLV